MFIVGLTGGIGAGKSTVSAMLAARGAVIVDADAITREVQAPGGPAYAAIVERFGPDVVLPDRSLDRAALAKAVFADGAARRDLEAATWPHVGVRMAERVAAHRGTDAVVVLDIPLLAERGRERYALEAVLVVDCPPEVAVRRAVEFRGMDEGDVRRRIAAQASRQARVAMADVVIDNSGDRDQLEAEVERAWGWLEAERESQP